MSVLEVAGKDPFQWAEDDPRGLNNYLEGALCEAVFESPRGDRIETTLLKRFYFEEPVQGLSYCIPLEMQRIL